MLNLYIEKVFNHKNDSSKYTITHEVGDIFDIKYFIKELSLPSLPKLLKTLIKEGCNPVVVNGVLVFDSKNEAKQARNIIRNLSKCQKVK